MYDLVLIGCGGHARSAADIYLANEPTARLAFVDIAARPGEILFGWPVLRELPETNAVFIAVGDNVQRKAWFEKFAGTKRIENILSTTAHYGRESKLGIGCMVGNFCHVGPQAVIGDNVIINNGAIVEHETVIGAHSHVGPNAVVAGRCRIGELVFVGAGACVRDGVEVCSEVVIGAGAVVVKAIVESGVYVGCPARKVSGFLRGESFVFA